MKTTIDAGSPSRPGTMRTREITEADLNTVIDLLMQGFPRRRQDWEERLGRLRDRSLPPNVPRYGYLLETDGRPVGVILVISTTRRVGTKKELFSNLSGWFVEPDFRSGATQLLKRALATRQSTYLNLYPAKHVRPIIEAFGFKRYSQGQVLAFPALAQNKQSMHVRIVGVDKVGQSDLEDWERQLLEAQASYGCITFCCMTEDQTLPFVFIPRVIKGFIPCAQLAYCRKVTDLVDVAGSVGRYLLQRARPFVLIDANGPIAGIPGRYFADVAPKYFKGATAPALGDLTETEATIFGFAPRRLWRA